jgi:DNA ligase-1
VKLADLFTPPSKSQTAKPAVAKEKSPSPIKEKKPVITTTTASKASSSKPDVASKNGKPAPGKAQDKPIASIFSKPAPKEEKREEEEYRESPEKDQEEGEEELDDEEEDEQEGEAAVKLYVSSSGFD